MYHIQPTKGKKGHGGESQKATTGEGRSSKEMIKREWR
jgi:hypothetical protein